MSKQEITRVVEIKGNWSPYDPETGERVNRLTMFREMVEELGLDEAGDHRIMEITARRLPSTNHSRQGSGLDFLQPIEGPISHD